MKTEVNNSPEDHQIRKSNNYAIGSSLDEFGISPEYFHFADDKSDIDEKLGHILKNYELVILSGGVSKGKFDYIPEAMEIHGVEKLFHRVKQRPGKPFWFGKTKSNFVFALPGNPVSTFMCFYKYIKLYEANQRNHQE